MVMINDLCDANIRRGTNKWITMRMSVYISKMWYCKCNTRNNGLLSGRKRIRTCPACRVSPKENGGLRVVHLSNDRSMSRRLFFATMQIWPGSLKRQKVLDVATAWCDCGSEQDTRVLDYLNYSMLFEEKETDSRTLFQTKRNWLQ